MKYTIDPEFDALLPGRTFAELEEQILADGQIIHGLVVWKCNKQHIILDGHTRYQIHLKHPTLKLPKPTVLDFESRDEAHDWILWHQISQRNPDDAGRKYIIGKLYLTKRPRAGQNLSSVKLTEDAQSADEIAEKAGVSTSTVHRDAAFAEALDAAPERVKHQVLAGNVKATTKALQDLAELPTSWMRQAVALIRDGQVKSVTAAIKETEPAPPPPEPPKDKADRPIPKSLLPVFELGDQVRKFARSMSSSVNAIVKECETKDGLTHSPGTERMALSAIKVAKKDLTAAINAGLPHAVCPYCKTGRGCAQCDNLGWLHKDRWDGIPKERRG